MMRILTILILLLAGLPQVGVGMVGGFGGHDCVEMGCQEPVDRRLAVVSTGCCDEPAVVVEADDFCLMSQGACHCGVASDEPHAPSPKAPIQRSDTKPTLGLSRASVEITAWEVFVGDGCAVVTGLVAGVGSLRTHNETRAFLGVWRT